ncbi:hypothetical protein O0L34_g11233 [Tuta absoluta]|nr:hypothetical protein O0L34_g11233 [Tuta absoluta]
MGCLNSKKENIDLHPNVFRVVNIDENEFDLCSGRLEITDTDLILFREGRDSIIWPLHSLRRYGFEDDLFSFESGRRCETGEGIYAFRCRRAAQLFRSLQQKIQLRNIVHDATQYPVSRLSPSPQSRQTLQASVVHRSSIDNGQPDNGGAGHNNNIPNPTIQAIARAATHNPRSPSSADILEVMPLYPRSQTNTSHVTNVYQLRDFKREHNNNQAETSSDSHHVYSNDLSRDLAILRNTLRQESALNTMREIEDETRFLEERYINGITGNNAGPLSPTLSSSSDHYPQLTMEQQQQQHQLDKRLYMNIAPPDKIAIQDVNKNDSPATPLTPKPVEYCNLNVGTRPEVNTYANLALGELADTVKNAKQKLHFTMPEANQKFSESDTFTSMSPVEELEVNYAVLDIDANKEAAKVTRDLVSPESHSYNSSKNESTASCSSHARSRLVSQTSLEKPPPASLAVAPSPNIGYTTIDFDKTVALTSVAAGTDKNKDGPRKTRHNSVNVVCGSPSSLDKVKA